MSAPVLKTPPSPRSRTTLMSSSSASSSRYAPSCSRIAGSYALRRSGLSSVRRAMPVLSSRSISTRLSLTECVLLGLRRLLDASRPRLTSRYFQRRVDRTAMDFRLDEEQLELQDTVRRFCAARFALERIAQRERPAGRPRRVARDGRARGLRPCCSRGTAAASDSAWSRPRSSSSSSARTSSSGPVLWTVLAAPYVDGAASGDRLVGGVEQVDAATSRSSSSTRPRSTRCWCCAPTACSCARAPICPRFDAARAARSPHARRPLRRAAARRAGRRRATTPRALRVRSARCSARRCCSACPTPRSRRRGAMRSSASSSASRSGRSRPSSTCSPTCTSAPRSPAAPPTPRPRVLDDPASRRPDPRERRGEAARGRGRARERARRDPGARRHRASPGRCCRTTCSSGPGCSSTRSATPMRTRSRSATRIEGGLA